jgi:hypothetical protein
MDPLSGSDAVTTISAYLAPDERLLWAGRPKQGLAVRALDFWVVPFALCWSAGIAYSSVLLIKQEGMIPELLYLLPFFLFGAYMLIGRFWIDAKARSITYYGVTNQRAIIMYGLVSKQIHSIYLKDLLEVRFTFRSDDTGTLEFFTSLGGFNRFRRFGFNRSQSWWPGTYLFIPYAFEMISNPIDVEALVLQAREAAQQSAS